jgi:hypothetical protein
MLEIFNPYVEQPTNFLIQTNSLSSDLPFAE